MLEAKTNKDFEKMLIARINHLAEAKKSIGKIPDSHYRIYLKATTLNGFNYLEFTLISPVKIKTMGGCTLTFKSADSEYVLKSESDTIEGDYSNSSKIGITLVDTDFDEEFDAFIKSTAVSEIKFDCKVGQVFKKTVSISYTEIDMKAFLASMVPKEAESTGAIATPGGGGVI